MTLKPARRIALFPALLGVVVIGAGIAGGCGGAEETAKTPELIEKGWESFAIGEFAIASKDFATAAGRGDTTPELKAQALYGRGMAESLGNTENAAEIPIGFLNQSIEAAPKSQWAGWSLMALARMKNQAAAKIGKDADWDLVRNAYQQVIDRFPDTPEAQEALLMQQASFLLTGKEEDARAVLTTVSAYMAAHPNGSMMVRCLDLQAEAYNTLGDGAHEVEARIKSLEVRLAQATEAFDKSGTYWSIATRSEFECGNFPVAREFYRRLIKEYPSDARVVGAKLALSRMDKLEGQIRQDLTTQPSTAMTTPGPGVVAR